MVVGPRGELPEFIFSAAGEYFLMREECFKHYGKMNHEFSGFGKMVLDNNKEYEIEFVFAQRDNGRLLFCAEFADINAMPNLGQTIIDISGTLEDGRPIKLDGVVSITSSLVSMTEEVALAILIGTPTGWTVGNAEFSGSATMHFDIANFRLMSGEFVIRVDEESVAIKPADNYQEMIAILSAQKTIRVTSKAMIEIVAPTQFDEKIECIEIICDLLTLARATLVNWLSFSIEVDGEGIVYSRFRNSVIRNFNPVELIPENDLEGLKRFLEVGYDRYKELNEIFQFHEIARRFVDTRGNSFLETRGLTIAVQVEILASRFAASQDRVVFMKEEDFNIGLPILTSEVRNVINKTLPSLKKEFIDGMAGKTRGFNYRGLAGKIRKLNNWLKAGISEPEISTFFENRNFLAHYGNFPDDKDKKPIFFQMAHFLDRLILHLFDYRGTYYNMEDRIVSQIK